jgi:predicted transcriptional regulator YdeE
MTLQSNSADINVQMLETKMRVGFEVVGLSVMLDNADGRAVLSINKLWQRFYNESVVDEITDKLGNEVYAVYSEYQGDHTKPYRLTIGCRVTGALPVPKGLHSVRVSAGPYQHVQATGAQPEALIQAWQSVWTSDLPRRFDTDYEIFGPRFFQGGLHEILLCIGVGEDIRPAST